MILQKLKESKIWIAENKGDLFIAVSFFLVALIGFGLGRVSVTFEKQKEAIRIEQISLPALAGAGAKKTGDMRFVGSKNSTVYYAPSCSGVSRIKEENKVWFSSKEEAEGLGYSPSKNCEGL